MRHRESGILRSEAPGNPYLVGVPHGAPGRDLGGEEDRGAAMGEHRDGRALEETTELGALIGVRTTR